MKVLIIGANSFTGQSLSGYLLKQGLEVFGTCNNKAEIKTASLFLCDITRPAEIAKVLKQTEPDYIINLAGVSFVAHADPSDFYNINTFAVESILKTCLTLEKKPNKIILASSSVVYGNQDAAELNEELVPRPQNHYGLSKLAMETIAGWYSDKLNIIITRPFNYTGPNQSKNFLIPKIVDHFSCKAKIIELGNINVFREFNDIEFVCDVYHRLLVSNITTGIYNICSGKGYCIADILKLMTELSGFQIEVKQNPRFVRAHEIYYLVGSNKKLQQYLGELHIPNIKVTLQNMYNC